MNWLSLDWMGWPDWTATACYLILALSYSVSNIYWLRILAVVSLALEAVYFWFAPETPLWVGIGWNFLFVTINIVQLGFLTHERLHVRFSEQEKLLHRGLFGELSRAEFNRLLKAGTWRDIPEGTMLAREGASLADVSVIVAGSARVEVGGKLLALLHPGAFIGEMSFLTKSNASADVTTVTPTRLFSISKQKLETLFDGDAALMTTIHRMIGQDLARKLLSTSHQDVTHIAKS